MAILAALASMLGKGAAGAGTGALAGASAASAAQALTGGLGAVATGAGAGPALAAGLGGGLTSGLSFAPFLKGAKEGLSIYGALKALQPPGGQVAAPTLPRAGGGGGSPGASPITQQLLAQAMQRRGQSGPEALIARLLQR